MSGFGPGQERTRSYGIPEGLLKQMDKHFEIRSKKLLSLDHPMMKEPRLENMKNKYYTRFNDDNVYLPRIASGVFWGLMTLANVANGIAWVAAPIIALPITLIGSALAYLSTYSDRDPDYFICIACDYINDNPDKPDDEVFELSYNNLKEYQKISQEFISQCELYEYNFD